jgi:hypothetical protein
MNPTPDFALGTPLSPHRETLAIVTTSGGKAPPEQSIRMVNAAAARIYQAWQPHVGHAEARAFAGRFHLLIEAPLAPLADEASLDATLEAVAIAMNMLGGAAEVQ